jgi:hypothetical protein
VNVRLNAVLAAALLACYAALPLPAAAGTEFQCQGGTNPAIVNACGARWEAANIRAHVAANAYGGASPSCLRDTADLLASLASVWLAENKYTAFSGHWPCGNLPQVAGADDGTLAQACPNAVWSYGNKGASGCDGSVVAQVAPAYAPAPYVAPPPPPPPDPFIGAWLNNYGVTETFYADGTAHSTTNNSMGTWRAEGGGRYHISWAAGSQYDVEVTLSADGRTFTWYEPSNTSTGGTATKQ